jgi:hypothetical protein
LRHGEKKYQAKDNDVPTEDVSQTFMETLLVNYLYIWLTGKRIKEFIYIKQNSRIFPQDMITTSSILHREK